MPSSARPKTDVLTVLRLFLWLPIFLLFIGVALIVAAIRGQMLLPGGIILEPGKYQRFGRVWAFILGLMMTLAIWGLLGWAWLYSGQISESSKIILASPSSAPLVTSVPASPTALSAIATREKPSSTPSATHSAVTPPTATRAPRTATPTPPPTPSATPNPAPTAETPAPLNSAQALQAVQAANILLRQAIVSPDADHLAALSTVWSGVALAQVQQFAVEMNRKYRNPLQVSYQLVGDLKLSSPPANNDTAIVSSTELWQFAGNTGIRTAMTAYRYTLHVENSHWKIVEFTFSVLATPTPAALTP